MNAGEMVLAALVAWTGLGVLGVTLALTRGERQRVANGARWLVGIWVIYLAVLVVVSVRSKESVLPVGENRCFDEMCFAVLGAEEVPGFLIRDGSRLIRVQVRIRNLGRAKAESESLVRAYLIDAQGRTWQETAGVSGVRLTATVRPGGEVLSEPMFKVAKDATGLKLLLNHGHLQPGVLVIGDPESVLHKPTVMDLGLR